MNRLLFKTQRRTNHPISSGFCERWRAYGGAPAKRQAITNPDKTIASVKRFMGRMFNEVSGETKLA